MLLCSASVSAQDVIVKKDGSTVVCRVVELNATEIVYKNWSDLNGSNYIMDRSLASAIIYENGKKEVLGEVQNQCTPGNQNDGVQQYNDKTLLKLDAATHNPPNYKRAATITKVVGWGIGAAAVGTGIYFLAFAEGHSHYKGMGAGIVAGGAIWTTGCLVLANYLDKKSRTIESVTVYQHNFNLNNGSRLSAGIDVLNDHNIGNSTLGLGLRYNF